MLNDRDDKFEGHEESEYHFSDDEASYEVETEAPKAAAPQPTDPKESLMTKLSRSKRMLITGVVFVVLVFVVYKMVSPTAVAPNTDITPTVPGATMAASQPNSKPTNAAVANSQPATVQPVTVPAITPPATQTTNMPVMAGMPGAPTAAPASNVNAPATPTTQAASAPSMMIGMPEGSTTSALTTVQNNTVTATTSMPTVIPVQSNVATEPTSVPSLNNPAVINNAATMQTNTQNDTQQLQADYAQKLDAYQAQNKILQDQVQTLNNRVQTMETQMAALVKALTRQMQAGAGAPDTGAAASYDSQNAVDNGKESYNVQAIIPGRAWLKSDSGETLTVAEGDSIHGLGRVTKIDPYDGVVEINTGSKVISLSYGNGG